MNEKNKTMITTFEWAIGLLGAGAAIVSFLKLMFWDNPHPASWSPLQQLIINTSGIWIYGTILVVFLAFIFQFFVKDVPWPHIVAVVGIIALICSYIFLATPLS